MSERYFYVWGNNEKRASYKGKPCQVIAVGKKNSVLIEFQDGYRMITSRLALKKSTAATESEVTDGE